MKKKKSTPPDKLTLKRINSNLSLLVFSILFLIISAILLGNQQIDKLSDVTIRGYFGVGFSIFSLLFFMFLIADLLIYYLSKSWKWFKNHFPKYKFAYYLFFLIVLLIVLFCIAYKKLDQKSFWTVTVGILGAGIVAGIGFLLKKRLFDRKKKRSKP